MPETAQKYFPQMQQPAAVRKLAVIAWSVTALIVLLWLALIAAPPFLLENGMVKLSEIIFGLFGYICHQESARSFHVNGHSLAVCTRCFGIYTGLAAGVLAFPLVRGVSETQPLPRIFLLLAPVPTAIDWALGIFGIWENTHWSRFFTGAVLGAVCAFFVVPGVVEIVRFVFLKNRDSKSAASFAPKTSAPSDYSRPDLRI